MSKFFPEMSTFGLKSGHFEKIVSEVALKNKTIAAQITETEAKAGIQISNMLILIMKTIISFKLRQIIK